VTLVLYSVVWGAVGVFLLASVARAVRYARQPIHLRWELYPVPHEQADRAAHGGSYFETSEWWTAPRRFNVVGEIRAMLPEMLFLDALRKANRPLWLRSFPFHFGLYLMAGSAELLVAAATIWLVAGSANAWVTSLQAMAGVFGILGVALSFAGACALLHRRLTDAALREYTTAGDLFNLVFFALTLGFLAVGYVSRPPGSAGALAVTRGLLTADSTLRVSTPFALALMAASFLVAYIPLTHMSHFIAKYFTYHAVRWDDAPLKDRDRMAMKVAQYLTYRPRWSAAHIGPGKRTWAQVAASSPDEARR
jgi:nitrate reductase gamma subunit